MHPHEALLRGWLGTRFPALPDLDDIVQEAFARVLRAHSPRTCEARFGQRSAGRISKRVMLITRGNWAGRWSSDHPRHSSRVAKYRAALVHAA